MKREWWIAAAVVALLIVGYLFLPVWQAGQRYASGDSADRCTDAQELALAWGGLGFAGKREEWKNRGALDCLRAEREASLAR